MSGEKGTDAIKVCVTGAAGQIAYSLLYSIAKGDVFGSDQRISLALLDIAPMMEVLNGVVMEMQDCALPLLDKVLATADVNEAFKDIDVAVLVGAMPRREGMERADLLKANVKIFKQQGEALKNHAKKSVKVLVVGNPANTNCLIAMRYASPTIPQENFSALTRLDQNRAHAQVALKLGIAPNAVQNAIIWGNHSGTQFPDCRHAVAHKEGNVLPVHDAIKDDHWLKNEFIKTVQSRGGAVIKARKLSSAMSAAKAICDHLRDWWFGTKEGVHTSMAVVSDGSYGIEQGLIYSFPVLITDKKWTIKQGLPIDDFAREKMDVTMKELVEERDTAVAFCQE